MTAHAKFSPSAAEQWFGCAAAIPFAADFPDTASEYADWGTIAHDIAARDLKGDHAVIDRVLGRRAVVADDGAVTYDTEAGILIDTEMIECVQTYVASVREYAQGADELLVEQRLSYSSFIDVPEQFGTSDAVILMPLVGGGHEIQVHDLKGGKGVRVDAERNKQLMIYALGAVENFGLLYDLRHARMVIHQPRLNHLSEWDCTIAELLAFAGEAKAAVERVKAAMAADDLVPHMNPSEDACRWCRGKAQCPKLREDVLATALDDFGDLTRPADADLDAVYPKIALIESWCAAIKARAHDEAVAGRPPAGFKLVLGKRGARAWTDENEAETLLKSFHLKRDEIYTSKVISPTQAEKVLTPRRWKKAQPLIVQPEGKPTLVPVDDKRPAINALADFDDLF